MRYDDRFVHLLGDYLLLQISTGRQLDNLAGALPRSMMFKQSSAPLLKLRVRVKHYYHVFERVAKRK